jgi:hypothetical protein
MAESHFIKTVTFGGFDKNEVIRRLEYLNNQVFSTQNELRENNLLIEGYKKGTSAEENYESVLAEERAKLTELQVQNDTLATKLKAAEEDNRKYEQEIKHLHEKLTAINDKLTSANNQLTAAQAGDEALALSAVFIEAKKTADMLESAAKQKAQEIESESKKAAEKSIAFANDEAANIINEAERKAAEIIAKAKNNASDMDKANDNLRATVLDKVLSLGKQINDFKDAIMKFEEMGVGNLYECEELLRVTEATLKEGGTPVFEAPKHYAPEYPEPPKKQFDYDSEDKEKRQSELDKLRQMAESIGNKNKSDNANDAENSEIKEAEEKMAEENADDKKNDASDKKKGGKIDLAALAAQAQALNKKK